MSKKVFTTAFNRSAESVRDVNVQGFTSPSKVKQSLSYVTDINKIYEQYCKTGRLPLNGAQPLYDENFVKYDSLIEAQKLVNDATLYFQSLPAKIKNQYGNSLEKFIYALNSKDDFLVKEGVLNINTVDYSKDIIEKDGKISNLPENYATSPSTPIIDPVTPVTEPMNTASTD